ncbi:hypothetical protein LDENG_00169270 [Lucifuga dentata]|nr:hypothetical protein LDENG_00169270 [Lucifuga dentata]
MPPKIQPRVLAVGGGNRQSTGLPDKVSVAGSLPCYPAATVAITTCLDSPGNVLANGALVKLSGSNPPRIKMTDTSVCAEIEIPCFRVL